MALDDVSMQLTRGLVTFVLMFVSMAFWWSRYATRYVRCMNWWQMCRR